MEFLQLSPVLIAVLAVVSSVEAGVTTFEQSFLPAGSYIAIVQFAAKIVACGHSDTAEAAWTSRDM